MGALKNGSLKNGTMVVLGFCCYGDRHGGDVFKIVVTINEESIRRSTVPKQNVVLLHSTTI